MKKKLVELFQTYREIIAYGIVGCCTTLLNIVAFIALKKGMGIPLVLSNVLAWVVAFIFSFFANRKFVFCNKEERNTMLEMVDFLWTRLATMLLDTTLMWLFVEVFMFEALFSKVFVNIVVIILNYITCKIFVFRNVR